MPTIIKKKVGFDTQIWVQGPAGSEQYLDTVYEGYDELSSIGPFLDIRWEGRFASDAQAQLWHLVLEESVALTHQPEQRSPRRQIHFHSLDGGLTWSAGPLGQA